jgi:hypothetical protein
MMTFHPFTSFTGLIIDQAAHHRVIVKIRNMNPPLISVNQPGLLQEDQHKLNSSCWEDHLLRDKNHLSEDQKLNRIVLQ